MQLIWSNCSAHFAMQVNVSELHLTAAKYMFLRNDRKWRAIVVKGSWPVETPYNSLRNMKRTDTLKALVSSVSMLALDVSISAAVTEQRHEGRTCCKVISKKWRWKKNIGTLMYLWKQVNHSYRSHWLQLWQNDTCFWPDDFGYPWRTEVRYGCRTAEVIMVQCEHAQICGK